MFCRLTYQPLLVLLHHQVHLGGLDEGHRSLSHAPRDARHEPVDATGGGGHQRALRTPLQPIDTHAKVGNNKVEKRRWYIRTGGYANGR